MLDCIGFDVDVVPSSSGLLGVARLKLNELAIALSEEVTLEAEREMSS